MSSASLLIVVIVATVTVVIIATAIPSFLRSPGTTDGSGGPPAVTAKLKAGEAGVLSALRVITEAENAYALTGQGGYATYSDLRAGGLIDSAFSDAGTRGGYRYRVSVGASRSSYCITATRLSRDDGDLAYTVSQQGAIYQTAGDSAPACNADTGQITSGTIIGR
jgi:hypothetical protein